MQETIENASKLLKNYRGKLTKQERIKNMVYIISFFVMLFLVVIAGVYERIGIAIFLTLLYLFAVFATSYTFKKRASPLSATPTSCWPCSAAPRTTDST